jgi:hypothetical protein
VKLAVPQSKLGNSWREAAAHRFGDDELKWRPALLAASNANHVQVQLMSKCLKEWLAIWDLAHVPLSFDSQRPEAGVQVE